MIGPPISPSVVAAFRSICLISPMEPCRRPPTGGEGS